MSRFVCEARPVGRTRPRRSRQGLRRTHAHPGAGDPRHPRRPRSRPAPRPAPARPPASPCRFCSASQRHASEPAGAQRGPRADPRRRRASWRPRSRRASSTYGRHLPLQSDASSTAGSASSPDRRHCGAASTSWSPRPDGCSTTCTRDASTSRTSRSSSSTRRTGCSTWASSATSAASWPCCPRDRQNLLFSATFPTEIRQLAELSARPRAGPRSRRQRRPTSSRSTCILVDAGHKRELLAHLILDGRWKQVLVFTRTKHGANQARRAARKDGVEATAIHGNKSQGARTKALADFKDGSVRVLVATDIAARGLDIDELPHVVNYELPHVPEDYVHRIGRTGRAGNTGEAISLVARRRTPLLADIEKLLKRKLVRGPFRASTGTASPPQTPPARASSRVAGRRAAASGATLPPRRRNAAAATCMRRLVKPHRCARSAPRTPPLRRTLRLRHVRPLRHTLPPQRVRPPRRTLPLRRAPPRTAERSRTSRHCFVARRAGPAELLHHPFHTHRGAPDGHLRRQPGAGGDRGRARRAVQVVRRGEIG